MNLRQRHPEIWNCYRDLRQRHFNPRNPSFQELKGLEFPYPDFRTFCRHILDTIGPKPALNYRLTRRDLTLPYDGDNFQWLTHQNVVRRGRAAYHITYNRRRYCLKEFCEKYNLSYWKFKRRLLKGQTVLEAKKGSQI